jgi:hypothetical protein
MFSCRRSAFQVVNDLQKSKETLTSVRKRRAEAAAAVEGAKAGKEDLVRRAAAVKAMRHGSCMQNI